MSLGAQTFLVITDDTLSEGAIRAALPTNTSIRFVSLRDALDSTAELIEESAPSVVLVGCSSNPEWGLRVITEAANVRPGRPIIALYGGNPNGFMDPAFRAGADDLIVLPQPPDQLAFELQKVIARRRTPDTEAQSGTIITVLGPKGGTGKTVTATNLAVALAATGANPIVVDIDLQFGDVGLALGLKPESTIFDLVMAGGSIDAEKVSAFALRHRSGTVALLAPTRPDQAAVVTTAFLRDLFTVLRRSYEFVIVDTAPAFSPEVIVAIDASTHLCLVGMLDALSLKDTKIGLETLTQMGYSSDDVTLVLNRADSSVGISMSDVYTLLRKSPNVLVPSDRSIPRALTVGETIYESAPNSGAGRSFGALAQHYLGLSRVTEQRTYDDTLERRAEGSRRRRILRKGN